MSNENMPVEQHFPMSDDPKEPVEQSQDLARIKRAYRTACFNITELTDQRAKLTAAIDGAIQLINQLLMEMRNKGVAPSPQIIAFKAGFDQGMRKLLGRDE
jgi:hypothetical protein